MVATSPAEAVAAPSYVPLAVGIAAALILGLLFQSTVGAIVSTWNHSVTFTHGFLILPICFYLAWGQRRLAASTPVQPQLWGVTIIVLGALGWLVGHVTATLLVQELCFVLIGEGVFLTLFGWRMWRVFAFPLLYLFFAVPVGLELVGPLQARTAAISIFLLNATGVPVYSDGNLIQIPNGTFYVAEACSGIRYLIASIALGVLVAGIAYRSWWRRLAFLALSIVVPILANGVRAFSIVLLAYHTDSSVAEGIDHIIYGWVFFSLVTFLVLAIGSSFRDDQPIAVASGGQTGPSLDPGQGRHLGLAGIFAFIPLVLVVAYSHHLGAEPPIAVAAFKAPTVSASWEEDSSAHDPLPPRFAGADFQLSTAYRPALSQPGSAVTGREVYLDIGYYARSRAGAKPVSSDHVLVPGPIAIFTSEAGRTISIGDQRISVPFRRLSLGSRQRLITIFYWIDGRFTGNPYIAKILEAKAKLLGEHPEAAIIALATDYEDMPAIADKAIEELAASLHDLDTTLQRGVARQNPPASANSETK